MILLKAMRAQSKKLFRHKEDRALKALGQSFDANALNNTYVLRRLIFQKNKKFSKIYDAELSKRRK